jgi:hypothetical protein
MATSLVVATSSSTAITSPASSLSKPATSSWVGTFYLDVEGGSLDSSYSPLVPIDTVKDGSTSDQEGTVQITLSGKTYSVTAKKMAAVFGNNPSVGAYSVSCRYLPARTLLMKFSKSGSGFVGVYYAEKLPGCTRVGGLSLQLIPSKDAAGKPLLAFKGEYDFYGVIGS